MKYNCQSCIFDRHFLLIIKIYVEHRIFMYDLCDEEIIKEAGLTAVKNKLFFENL